MVNNIGEVWNSMDIIKIKVKLLFLCDKWISGYLDGYHDRIMIDFMMDIMMDIRISGHCQSQCP